jgi:hypothetical protein
LPLTAIKSVRAMPEDDAPPNAVEPNAEHYYLEINTVRVFHLKNKLDSMTITRYETYRKQDRS